MDLQYAEHLGDGAYVAWNGYAVVLMANSHLNPTDTVELEPYALDKLLEWVSRLKKSLEAGE